MTGLVLELQNKVRSGAKASDLLRDAYIVAKKLKIEEFEKWINYELNGYAGSEIPIYRKLRVAVVALNPYAGYIPVILQEDLVIPIYDSLCSLEALIENNKGGIIRSKVNFEMQSSLTEFTGQEYQYLIEFSSNQIRLIIEIVKNIILKWSLKLEENGIRGEGLSFTSSEVTKAKEDSVSNVYNFSVYGDVNDSQIGQGSNNSTQKM